MAEGSIQARFQDAVGRIKSGGGQLKDDQKLAFYGYFKQAQEGDVRSACPALWDLTGRAKWSAWKRVEGMSKVDAQRAYIDLADRLLVGGTAASSEPGGATEEEEEQDWDEDDAEEAEGTGRRRAEGGLSLGNKVSTMAPIGAEGGGASSSGDGEEEQEKEDIFFYAKTGAADQVERLLGEGVSIHNTDEEGRTALHWAADAGQLGVVKLLVQRGANVQQKDNGGETALDYAVTCDYDEVISLLQQEESRKA